MFNEGRAGPADQTDRGNTLIDVGVALINRVL